MNEIGTKNSTLKSRVFALGGATSKPINFNKTNHLRHSRHFLTGVSYQITFGHDSNHKLNKNKNPILIKSVS